MKELLNLHLFSGLKKLVLRTASHYQNCRMEGLNWNFVSICQRAEVVAITLIVLALLQFFQLKIHNIHMYMYLQNSIRCNNDDIHMSFINTSRRLDLNCMCAFISLFKLLFVMCH